MTAVLQRVGRIWLRRGAFALLVGLLAVHGAANAQPRNQIRAAVVALAFDPGTRALYKATSENLYRSDDQGRTWTLLALPPAVARGRIAAVAFSAGDKGALYVAGPGMGVLRSDDRGGTWTTRSKGLPSNRIVALAAHADQPGTVYVDVAGRGIFRSMNGGERWRRILPRLVDLAMRNKEATRFRAQLVPAARGAALEVGVGSGLNLRFYGDKVERLVCVAPSEELLRMARRRARGMAFPVEFLARPGEELPARRASIDSVVLTFTLCTIQDPLEALREMRRVLKPSGELLFAGHGLAPGPAVQRWQRRLNPLWHRVAGGCNLDRKIDELIGAAGFRLTGLATEYAKGPRPMSYVYLGQARRA